MRENEGWVGWSGNVKNTLGVSRVTSDILLYFYHTYGILLSYVSLPADIIYFMYLYDHRYTYNTYTLSESGRSLLHSYLARR